MESLLLDIRYALRTLVKNRGFTAIVVLILAVGTGVTTAIFSVVPCVFDVAVICLDSGLDARKPLQVYRAS